MKRWVGFWPFSKAVRNDRAVGTDPVRTGECRLIVIDGLGLPQAIPLAKWFGFAKKRFLQKRRAKQDKAIGRILAARESGEDPGGKGMILPSRAFGS